MKSYGGARETTIRKPPQYDNKLPIYHNIMDKFFWINRLYYTYIIPTYSLYTSTEICIVEVRLVLLYRTSVEVPEKLPT